MLIIGSLDALWGLGGILDDDVVVVGGTGAIIADVSTWGWVHLVLGSLIALTGIGLLTGDTAARLPASSSFSSTRSRRSSGPAAPLWAFLLIILDVVIIYQLTVRWDQQAGWD